MTVAAFEAALTSSERRLLRGLSRPAKIQDFLDTLVYSDENAYRCPLRVLRERVGHCFDGALFAAMALRRLGQPPRILDLLPNRRDDDHLLALYQVNGHWGALAKSNFAGLRFREPVYRTLRELVLSFFELYYNLAGEKTLRGYTAPLSLKPFDRLGWLVRDEPIDLVAERLDQIRKVTLITPAMAARLQPVDERSYQAGLQGARSSGLFQVPARKTLRRPAAGTRGG